VAISSPLPSIVVLDHELTVFDGDQIGFHPDATVDEAAAGGDLKLPEVPGTTDDLAVLVQSHHIVAGAGREIGYHAAGHRAGAERTQFVRAEIAQRVEAAIDVEDADTGAATKWYDDLALTRGDLVGGSHNTLWHGLYNL